MLYFLLNNVICLGPSTTTETETVAKYEIMDGAPVKGKHCCPTFSVYCCLNGWCGFCVVVTIEQINLKKANTNGSYNINRVVPKCCESLLCCSLKIKTI